MARRTISAIVAGTGFEGREKTIQAFCKEGAQVQLRREPTNRFDPEAIAVWLRCSAWFGLMKTWRQIGYLKAARVDFLTPKIDAGTLTINRASVRSFYAPIGYDHPRVPLEIEVSEQES